MQQLQLEKRLATQLRYVFEHSHFYRRKFENYLYLNFTDPENFSSLPFTTKSELLEDQQTTPPFGTNLCVPLNKISRVHKTSGTTNKPLMIALTEEDIKHTVAIGKKCFESAGLKADDMVVHCLNYTLWSGGYTDHQSLEATGACVVPFGVGNSKLLIETILNLKPTAIHCTPSYLHKLELLLDREFHLKPKDLGLKLGLFGAESGLQSPEFKKSIEEKWGFKAKNSNYGMADVMSMFGAECDYDSSLHFFAEEKLYPELIDPEKGNTLKIEDGTVGELVLTNLCKEAQPLVRYRTNDIVEILSTEKCRCGEMGFRFEIIGRSDDMFTMKGVNVFVSSIDNIVHTHLNTLTGGYQTFISKRDPIEQMLIKLELRNKEINKKEFKNDLINDFRNRIEVTPQIVFVNEGELPRTEGKSKKLFRTL